VLYIIPFHAESIKDSVQVENELDVAEYFLVNDITATFLQKMLLAVFSDFVLDYLFDIVKTRPRELYLRHIFDRLEDGMDSGFCWGTERFAKNYFKPIQNIKDSHLCSELHEK
jgi:hypothetical protein